MRGDDFDSGAITRLFAEMEREGRAVVQAGTAAAELCEKRLAFMRYQGQGHEIEIELPGGKFGAGLGKEIRRRFDALYQQQYGRTVPNVDVEIINWAFVVATPDNATRKVAAARKLRAARSSAKRRIYWGQQRKSLEFPCYHRANLRSGDYITGPALIIEAQTTTLVSPLFNATIDRVGNIILTATRPGRNN
jgi:N-methylhydantoinase A